MNIDEKVEMIFLKLLLYPQETVYYSGSTAKESAEIFRKLKRRIEDAKTQLDEIDAKIT